jgi:hypothetical protein
MLNIEIVTKGNGMKSKCEVAVRELVVNGTKYVLADQVHIKPKELDGMKYAIVRSRNQGVMCGYVESITGQTVRLHKSRQMWKYDSRFVLSDVAEYGMCDSSKAKLSCVMTEPTVMLEACGVLYCTEAARENLETIEAQDKR